jgi:hypothetical protein
MPLPVPASSDGPPPHASHPRTRQRWAQYRGSPNAFADRHSNSREWSAEERGRLINQNGLRDNSVLPRIITPRPSATAGRTLFTYTGEISGLPVSDAPSILNKSYTITADVEIPQSGSEGMLVTLGGRFGGYGLYLLKGKPVFTYNLVDLERFRWEGQQALAPGKHIIVFDFKYDGPGFGKGGSGVLSVDGHQVDSKTIRHTIPFLMSIDETFDVGVDTRTSVDDKDYQVPFRFTGKLNKLTVNLRPEPMSAEEQKQWDEAAKKVNLAAE